MENTQIQAAGTDATPASAPYRKPIGASGTSIMGGIITGEDYNTRLTGKFALRQYDIMRRSDASTEAALELVKQPLLNVERDVAPADTDDESDFRARFIKRELFERNIDFHQVAEEASTFFDYGHAVAEFTLELTEFEGRTMIGIADIGFRKQISIERWETTDHKPGITQRLSTVTDGGGTLRSIPMVKLIVWTNKKEGDNYEGISLLRFAFKNWDMKDKLGLVHSVGLEKMGIPTPVLGIPANANPAEVEAAEQSMRQYRSNEEAFIKKPAGWDLEKFDMSGQSLSEFLPTLQYHDRQIFMSVLAGFMALGSGDSSGSRAVGEVQYKPYIQKVSTFNRRFETPLNKFIKLLCDLNFTDNSIGYPKLKAARFEDDDITALANAVKAFKDAGMITPDYDTEQHIRKILHFPEAPEDLEADYEVKRKAALGLAKNPPAPGTPPTDKPAPTKASAIAEARAVQRKLIDCLVV
jgi:hypothetical protein